MGSGVLIVPGLLGEDSFVSPSPTKELSMTVGFLNMAVLRPIRSFAVRPHSRQPQTRVQDAPFSNLLIQQGLDPK